MDQLLQRGIDRFNHRQFFECHEILEQAWTTQAGPRRLFLQSLIHFAVGFYHHQRGNSTGAANQLHKGIGKLTPYLPVFDGIDTASLAAEIQVALRIVESGQSLSDYPLIRLRS